MSIDIFLFCFSYLVKEEPSSNDLVLVGLRIEQSSDVLDSCFPNVRVFGLPGLQHPEFPPHNFEL